MFLSKEKKSGDLMPYVILHDGMSTDQVRKVTAGKPACPEKVIVVVDHDAPSGTVEVAQKHKILIEYARDNGTRFYYGRGIGYHIAMDDIIAEGEIAVGTGRYITTMGAKGIIAHRLTAEEVAEILCKGTYHYEIPRNYVIHIKGAFYNHTSAKDLALYLLRNKGSYRDRNILFTGGESLTLQDRITICNLMGNAEGYSVIFADTDCESDIIIDLSEIEKTSVLPGGFDGIVPSTRMDGVRVNQVFIGGCCGGSIESMRQTAALLEGKRISKYVRTIIAPATSAVYAQMIDEGLIKLLMQTGVVIMNQGCAACWAQNLGRVDDNEVFVTTGSHNGRNWSGDNNNGIYIVSTEIAVKCALTGNLYEN